MIMMRDTIIDWLKNADDCAVFEIFNEYCDTMNIGYNLHYNNEEFLTMCCNGDDLKGFADMILQGDYDTGHEYAYVDNTGYLQSFDSIDWDDMPEDISDVAAWCIRQYDGDYATLADKLGAEYEDEETEEE